MVHQRCSQARRTASSCSRVDRLRQVVPRAGLDALLAVALHRLGRHGDDRQVLAAAACLRISRIVSMPSISGIMMSISTMSMSGSFCDAGGSRRGRCRPRRSPCRAPRARWTARRCCACRRRRSAPSCRRATCVDVVQVLEQPRGAASGMPRQLAVQRQAAPGRAAARATRDSRTRDAPSRAATPAAPRPRPPLAVERSPAAARAACVAQLRRQRRRGRARASCRRRAPTQSNARLRAAASQRCRAVGGRR